MMGPGMAAEYVGLSADFKWRKVPTNMAYWEVVWKVMFLIMVVPPRGALPDQWQ